MQRKNKIPHNLAIQIFLLALFFKHIIGNSNRIEKICVIKSKYLLVPPIKSVLCVLHEKNFHVYAGIYTQMSSFYSCKRIYYICHVSYHITYKFILFFFGNFIVFLIGVYHSCLTSHWIFGEHYYIYDQKNLICFFYVFARPYPRVN